MMLQKSRTQQTIPHCFSCGSKLRRIDGKLEVFRCRGCGEEYDLGGFGDVEIDLETFGRMLLYTMRRARTSENLTFL